MLMQGENQVINEVIQEEEQITEKSIREAKHLFDKRRSQRRSVIRPANLNQRRDTKIHILKARRMSRMTHTGAMEGSTMNDWSLQNSQNTKDKNFFS